MFAQSIQRGSSERNDNDTDMHFVWAVLPAMGLSGWNNPSSVYDSRDLPFNVEPLPIA